MPEMPDSAAIFRIAGHDFHGKGSFVPRRVSALTASAVLLALGALVALSESMETALTVVGALLLAIGHALNWHGLRQSGVRATGEVAA